MMTFHPPSKWQGVMVVCFSSLNRHLQKMGYTQYDLWWLALILAFFSISTLIFRFALPIVATLVFKTTLLLGSTLPYRFLITWIRAKVGSIWLMVIPSLRVISFPFCLVGLAIVSLGEKLGYKVSCVFFC